ncbi:MAG: hypothetical protein ACOX1X_00615 [Dethiobacteria bacterium]|jgi:hypothetical protein
MTCGQYSLANLTEKELQRLKEAEKTLSNLADPQNERSEEQEIVLVAYRHAHQ